VRRKKGKPDTPWPNASPIVFLAKASRGEERTFALLKKLPDDYLIYYEPNIDNRHPDFIVIAPDPGVIIIEVKGWYPDDIVRGDHSELTINTDNRERKEIHPLGQARNSMGRLFRACENSPGIVRGRSGFFRRGYSPGRLRGTGYEKGAITDPGRWCDPVQEYSRSSSLTTVASCARSFRLVSHMIVGLIWKYPCTILSRIPANSFQGTSG
jgi:hypothetical protein